ncbi:hypothetical protein RRG08_052473 [Elysia crispata]|uniref:Uncharacterized protein n=1 Tax=Elysia crispata TaxID=231223 RepID=A0AAE1B129_9GAST|nr:hypothetical protein RRG08_052473 [Elysia crispata]
MHQGSKRAIPSIGEGEYFSDVQPSCQQVGAPLACPVCPVIAIRPLTREWNPPNFVSWNRGCGNPHLTIDGHVCFAHHFLNHSPLNIKRRWASDRCLDSTAMRRVTSQSNGQLVYRSVQLRHGISSQSNGQLVSRFSHLGTWHALSDSSDPRINSFLAARFIFRSIVRSGYDVSRTKTLGQSHQSRPRPVTLTYHGRVPEFPSVFNQLSGIYTPACSRRYKTSSNRVTHTPYRVAAFKTVNTPVKEKTIVIEKSLVCVIEKEGEGGELRMGMKCITPPCPQIDSLFFPIPPLTAGRVTLDPGPPYSSHSYSNHRKI